VPPARFAIPFVARLIAHGRVPAFEAYAHLSPHKALESLVTIGSKLNEGNPWSGSSRPIDLLRAKLGFWRALGATDTVVSWIGYGVPMPFAEKLVRRQFPNPPMSAGDAEFVISDTAAHEIDGTFTVVPECFPECINPVFVDSPPSGKKRRVDDLRYPNAMLAWMKFTLMSLAKETPLLVSPGDTLKAEDLEKAYYKIPVALEFVKFQCFRSPDGRLLAALCLLFGQGQAPFFFTKICRPIVRFFGMVKLPCFNYIDDFFWALKQAMMRSCSPLIDSVFGTLGWSLSKKKSQMGHRITTMGFEVDAARREYSVPACKIARALTVLRRIRRLTSSSLPVLPEDVSSFAGLVLSMSLAIPHVRIWTRELYRYSDTFRPPRLLSVQAVDELDRLEILLQSSNARSFIDERWEAELFCDTGETGWGAHIAGQDVDGLLPLHAIGTSSTFRELTGLLLALHSPVIQPLVTDRVLRVYMDSSSAIANIVNGGGPVPVLCNVIKAIWCVCDTLSVRLDMCWVSRNEPMLQHVDALSRVNTRWALRPLVARRFEVILGVVPWVPDFARVGVVVAAAISRATTTALVVPRWEAKAWWHVLSEHATIHTVAQPRDIFEPKGASPPPPWPFVVAVFRPRVRVCTFALLLRIMRFCFACVYLTLTSRGSVRHMCRIPMRPIYWTPF
jgi:hypothetical protein